MSSPKISAVVTTYNRPDKLLRCLQAIKAQTSSPLETIIVHDGSAADFGGDDDYWLPEHIDHLQ